MADTLSKADWLKASARLQPGYGPTQDFADPSVGLTVQSPGGIPASSTGLPGQVFVVEQLPNPAVAQAAGLPPFTVPADLIIEGDEIGKNVQGPSFLELQGVEEQKRTGFMTQIYNGEAMTAADALQTYKDNTGPEATDSKFGANTDNSVKDSSKSSTASKSTGTTASTSTTA